MIKLLIKIVSKYEFVRFAIIGCCAALIHYAVYLLFEKIIGINYNFAYVIGFAVSLICNFFASNLFTFRTKPTVTRFLKFISSHGLKVFLDMALLNLLVWSGVSATYAPIGVFAIVFPVSFLFVRFALHGKKSCE